LASLIKNDVLISTGSACHSEIEDISPVLKAMNVDLMTAGSTVRISTGKYTTRKEIDFAVEVISKTVLKLSH
jgi:cysteine desulfurase